MTSRKAEVIFSKLPPLFLPPGGQVCATEAEHQVGGGSPHTPDES